MAIAGTDKVRRGLRLSYKGKLLAYFTALFLVFAGLLVAFQYYREKEYKKELLFFQLRSYADITANAVRAVGLEADSGELDNLVRLFPKELRLTVISRDGRVNYENDGWDVAQMGNHLDRPEVRGALDAGESSDIRHSATEDRDFFYFARAYDGFVVRMALPHDGTVSDFLEADRVFLWFVVLIFPVVLVLLIYIADHFGKSLDGLRLFISSAERGLVDYNHITFPHSELGDIGNAILRNYKQLEETNRALEEQRARTQQMSHNITHELRTPVSSIRGYIETVLEHPELPVERQHDFLAKADRQVVRLTDLIRDVALITKAEEAPGSMPRETLDLGALVADLAEELRPQVDAAGMTLACNVPTGLEISGNYSLAYSIFRNLMENSLRYAGRGSTMRISYEGERAGLLSFAFADNGCGVAPEHLPRLFERFYRVGEGRTRDDGGTGLGLSIVWNAVAFHHGTIRASLPPAGGLRFDFTLRRG